VTFEISSGGEKTRLKPAVPRGIIKPPLCFSDFPLFRQPVERRARGHFLTREGGLSRTAEKAASKTPE
jgi:hypothetical protein